MQDKFLGCPGVFGSRLAWDRQAGSMPPSLTKLALSLVPRGAPVHPTWPSPAKSQAPQTSGVRRKGCTTKSDPSFSKQGH